MNRTCQIVIDRNLRKELVLAKESNPYPSRIEFSFAGHTLAAKWFLNNWKKFRLLKDCREIWIRAWNDNPKNESDYEVRCLTAFYGQKHLTMDDFAKVVERFEMLANDKDEQKLDLEYAKKEYND